MNFPLMMWIKRCSLCVEEECRVEIHQKPKDSKSYNEGELVKIQMKWYKVENCRLNRAYFAPCASKLFYQIRDFACSTAEQSSSNKKLVQRETTNYLMKFLQNQLPGYKCCESACTISELIRSCPSKW